MKKLTVEEFEEKVKSRTPDSIEYLGLVSTSWNNIREAKVKFFCKKHKKEFILDYQNIFSPYHKDNLVHCPLCIKEERYEEHSKKLKKNNEDSAKKRINEFLFNQPHIEFLGFEGGKYDGNLTKVNLRCKNHNLEFKSVYREITKESIRTGKEKYHCPECLKEYFSNRTPTWIIKNEKEAIEEVKNRLPNNIEFLGWEEGNWVGSAKARVLLFCKLHKEEFSVLFRYLVKLDEKNNPLGCPKCHNENKTVLSDETILKMRKNSSLKKDEVLIRVEKFLENNPHIELITDINTYDGLGAINFKVTFRCKIHDVMTTVPLTTIIKNSISGEKYNCPKCAREASSSKKRLTPEEAYNLVINKIKESGIKSIYDYSKIKDTYTNSLGKVVITCPIHGDFEVNFATLMKNKNGGSLKGRCPECFKYETTEKEALLKIKEAIEYKKELLNYDLEFIGFVGGTWEGAGTKLILRCKIHNTYQKSTSYSSFLKNPLVGCRVCSKASGVSGIEEKCREIIEKYIPKDEIESQHLFEIHDDVCNLDRKVFVDFYIKKLNLVIEYDGIQHFEFIDFYHHGSYKKFVNQVNRDNCLNNFCKINSINLLRISYKDNDRLDEVINSFLKNGIDVTTKISPKLLPISLNLSGIK